MSREEQANLDMKHVAIVHLQRTEFENALPLVWNVFIEYEATDYPEAGKQAFRNAIYSEEYLNDLDMYGAYEDKELIGVIATRAHGTHIALFFVDGRYHRRGIGKKLFWACMKNNSSKRITVHSSLYAAEVYRRLGFTDTGKCQEEGGIRYMPMEWRRQYRRTER